MTSAARVIVAIAAMLCGTAIAVKLVDALTAENRRLLSAQVAATPRDFGVLAGQQDVAERSADTFEQIVDKLPDLDYHLAGLRGEIPADEPVPNQPHGL